MCRAESYLSKRRLKKYHLMGFGLNPNPIKWYSKSRLKRRSREKEIVCQNLYFQFA